MPEANPNESQSPEVFDSFWVKGVNSFVEPVLLKAGEYQWGVNVDNSGGTIQTRSGYSIIGNDGGAIQGEPRGLKIFKSKAGVFSMVKAVGTRLWAAPYPFDTFTDIGYGFGGTGKVTFQKVVRNAETTVEFGEFVSKKIIQPIPYLIMQGGGARAKYWDGVTLSTSDPSDENQGIPIGKWMTWSGGRLWISDGRTLHASDLGDPLIFNEQRIIAGGGAIYFPDEITGLFVTPEFRSLIVSTDYTTSAILSEVADRSQWGNTPNFQKVLLPGIGCAAGDTYCHQFGMTWWMSHGGLVAMDQAINTYRSSRISFRDQEMMRSKSNLSQDISGMVARSFGNYLLVSVPSGSQYNAHTWVMNERVIDIGADNSPPAWLGIWTGLNVISMDTAVVEGEQRIFALSRDIGANGLPYSNVWELFQGEKEDSNGYNAVRIPSSLETKYLGMSKDLKTFEWAELEISEVRGLVDLQVYVAGRRGGYNQILNMKINAAEGNPNTNIEAQAVTNTTATTSAGTITVASTAGFLTPDLVSVPQVIPNININGRRIPYTAKTATTFTTTNTLLILSGTQVTQPQFRYPTNPTLLRDFLPQHRIVRTHGWNAGNSCPAESKFADNIDRAFSLLIKWRGKLAITGIRISLNPETDYEMGKCEDDEILARSLDSFGTGNLSSVIVATPTSAFGTNRRKYMRTVTPKTYDEPYSSYIL